MAINGMYNRKQVPSSMLRSLLILAAIFSSLAAKAACPAQEYDYNRSKQNESYYRAIYSNRRTCPAMKNYVAAARERVLAGRRWDKCLRSMGAFIEPDHRLTASWNNLAAHYNQICSR
jgi:hypothetical protein